MQSRFWIGVIALFACSAACTAQPAIQKDQILPLLTKACDWQLSILPTEHIYTNDTPASWIRAPFYDGTMALYGATQDQRYLDAMVKVGEENRWGFLKRSRRMSGFSADLQLTGPAATQPYIRHADDLAVGQLYLELYLLKHDEKMIEPLHQRLDAIMADPKPGREDWWWCDSLFMAPPTYARMSAATGDRKYLDYMDRQWWDTTDFLYDKQEHLYFRDKTYFHKKERNGEPVFWSRGNAWVMGGIVRVLQYMPADYPTRGKYVRLLNEMAGRIASLQQSDGFWRVSLLDPDAYGGKETSGTGLYTYAMAWGINNGILPAEQFGPVVRRAWAGLATVVNPRNGEVGWVQKVGSAPAAVRASDIAEYGTGALMLAGTEVLKMGR